MNSYYSIFPLPISINYYEDFENEIRGLRKRPVDTLIFIVDGKIEAKMNGYTYILKLGTEFTFTANQWHGWKTIVHSKIIQYIPHFDIRREESKEYDDT